MDQQGNLAGAMGAPGGSSILKVNAKGLIGTLVYGLPVRQAFDLPNVVAKGDSFSADADRSSHTLRNSMDAAGIHIEPNASENSGCMAACGG